MKSIQSFEARLAHVSACYKLKTLIFTPEQGKNNWVTSERNIYLHSLLQKLLLRQLMNVRIF